jgi:hypothetical protein
VPCVHLFHFVPIFLALTRYSQYELHTDVLCIPPVHLNVTERVLILLFKIHSQKEKLEPPLPHKLSTSTKFVINVKHTASINIQKKAVNTKYSVSILFRGSLEFGDSFNKRTFCQISDQLQCFSNKMVTVFQDEHNEVCHKFTDVSELRAASINRAMTRDAATTTKTSAYF